MNIKKLLTISLLAVMSNMHSSYSPAIGPIVLLDSGAAGEITLLLMNSSHKFSQSKSILDFMDTQIKGGARCHIAYNGQRWISYQEMIDRIARASSKNAAEALKGYAEIIMHMYEEKAYIIKASFLPHYLSPIRGLRSPFSLMKKRSAMLDQLLNEYDNLATIAMDKDIALGLHMKAIVKTYKHWKTCAATTAAAIATIYLLYDVRKRDQKDTVVYGLFHKNLKPILRNIAADLKINDATKIPQDMPKNSEDAVIELMLKSKTSKDQLLNKEILSAISHRKAVEAEQKAIVAIKEAASSTQEIFKLETELKNQETTAQRILSKFYRQKCSGIDVATQAQEKPFKHSSTLSSDVKVDSNPFCESIVQMREEPSSFDSHSSSHMNIDSNSVCEKIMAIPTIFKANTYNCFKKFINTYIDPASPSAIL